MASVSLRGLTRIYDRRVTALRDLSLEVADGELVALLGPSGCGKSTVLRTVAGLEIPDAGQVLIGERDVTRLPPAERNVAMVFQNYALYPHLTVRENLAFPLRMRRVPAARAAERLGQVAAQLGLGELLDRLPAQLSGGQRQRVALGRAMVREPAVFLLDEPLSNLDAALRAQLRAELLELHAALRATMLYVTHDQVEALTLGRRLVVLKDGVIEQVGTPAEVYDRPASTFVARFVGTPGMNLVPRPAGDGGPTLWAVAGDAPAEAAILGVRPEDLLLDAPGRSGAVAATVAVVERLGSETLLHLDGADGRVIARVPGLATLTPGTAVGLRLRTGRGHWFDRAERRAS